MTRNLSGFRCEQNITHTNYEWEFFGGILSVSFLSAWRFHFWNSFHTWEMGKEENCDIFCFEFLSFLSNFCFSIILQMVLLESRGQYLCIDAYLVYLPLLFALLSVLFILKGIMLVLIRNHLEFAWFHSSYCQGRSYYASFLYFF